MVGDGARILEPGTSTDSGHPQVCVIDLGMGCSMGSSLAPSVHMERSGICVEL